jgi:hypothetical protein
MAERPAALPTLGPWPRPVHNWAFANPIAVDVEIA